MRIDVVDGDDGWPLVAALDQTVYPPHIMAEVVWRDVAWAHADRRVLVREGETVVCHVGLYYRTGVYADRPAEIVGVGGVMTHASARRRGCATAAMETASRIMQERACDFGLLFCEPHNEQFYTSLGWQRFAGAVFCEQPCGRIAFDMMAAMILPGRMMPTSGEIDLCGLPW